MSVPLDTPGCATQRRTATVTSGDQQDAITHATASGEPANPAGGHTLTVAALWRRWQLWRADRWYHRAHHTETERYA